MIEFEDEKYGKVVIYDETDVVTPENFFEMPVQSLVSKGGYMERTRNSCVIAFRNHKKEIAKLIKNRWGSLEDDVLKKFIYNYMREIFEPIKSRFDILDL